MRVAEVLVLVGALGALALGARAFDTPTAPVAGTTAIACAPTDPAWWDDRGGQRPWDRSTRLASNGALLACAPAQGSVRFTLTGDAALGRGAHAVVVHAGRVVWDAPVTDARMIDLAVDAGDAILVAFTNDLFRSEREDRGLWISAVAFASR